MLRAVLSLLLWSCKPVHLPVPFYTELAGYTIRFPITLADLRQEYPKGELAGTTRFIDSSQSVRTEWWFNDSWVMGSQEPKDISSLGNRNPRNQPHGIVMFLKNKEPQFDSVKTALEHRYKQPLKPLVFEKSHGDFSNLKPIYVCHINEDTFLVLTKPDSYRSEPHSLRIAIGYNLTKKEQEAFALLGGPIYDDKL